MKSFKSIAMVFAAALITLGASAQASTAPAKSTTAKPAAKTAPAKASAKTTAAKPAPVKADAKSKAPATK